MTTDYLQPVKERLAISFDHADSDLLRLIDEAMARITSWTSKKTYNINGLTVEDSLANSLIIEYVRYARSGAADMFRRNYLDLILNLQLEVAKNAAPTE